MCVVSNIMDDWNKRQQDLWKWTQVSNIDHVARQEVAELRQELESLKKLLKAAKIYDEETGQPDCEAEDKIKLVKDLAKKLDIDLEDVFD